MRRLVKSDYCVGYGEVSCRGERRGAVSTLSKRNLNRVMIDDVNPRDGD